MDIPLEAIHLSTQGLRHKLVWTFSYEVPLLSLKQRPSWLRLFQCHPHLHPFAQEVDEHLHRQQVRVHAAGIYIR